MTDKESFQLIQSLKELMDNQKPIFKGNDLVDIGVTDTDKLKKLLTQIKKKVDGFSSSDIIRTNKVMGRQAHFSIFCVGIIWNISIYWYDKFQSYPSYFNIVIGQTFK